MNNNKILSLPLIIVTIILLIIIKLVKDQIFPTVNYLRVNINLLLTSASLDTMYFPLCMGVFTGVYRLKLSRDECVTIIKA